MGFTGFSDDAFAFYEGLQVDNTKTYWTRHKATYEQAVRAPMEELFAELEPEFGAAKLFRPYRDVRFAKDKSPYKTHQGGVAGGYYFQLDADGLMVAGGMWAPDAEQLERFRAAVDEDLSGKALTTIVDDLRAEGLEIGGDRLKTRPRGTPPDHPRLDLLRHRSLAAHRGWPPEDWVLTPEVVERVRASWRALTPLIAWLRHYT